LAERCLQLKFEDIRMTTSAHSLATNRVLAIELERLRNQHQTQALRLEKTGLNPAKVLAWGAENDMGWELTIDLAELMTQGLRPAAAATHWPAMAARCAAWQRSSLPEGRLRLPPRRPLGYSLRNVPAQNGQQAWDLWEVRPPMGSEARLARPIDALFTTMFNGLDALGTRALTSAEYRTVLCSGRNWGRSAVYPVDGRPHIPQPSQFTWDFQTAEQRLQAMEDEGMVSMLDLQEGIDVHEAHKSSAGGQGTLPGRTQSVEYQPGQRGERGIYARFTAEVARDPRAANLMVDRSAIKKHLEKQFKSLSSTRPKLWDFFFGQPREPSSHWRGVEKKLIHLEDSMSWSVLGTFVAEGWVADPIVRKKVEALELTLQATKPGTKEREAAAKALVNFFWALALSSETISVAAMQAQVNMVQVMGQWILETGANLADPNQMIDAVEIYKVSRRMQASGDLISADTLKQWLTEWHVAFVP
jgi:hypothetical protein